MCLIPYGCVATGPNSGIIEVVKDAKTVANVRIFCTSETFQLHNCIQISGIRNANKLLQWIKDHQKEYVQLLAIYNHFIFKFTCSQFGEEDPDLVQLAINRFVRSCAGYSVATYVLV